MFVSCLVRLVFTFKIRFRRVVHVRAQFFVCIKRPMQIVYNTRYFHRRARYENFKRIFPWQREKKCQNNKQSYLFSEEMIA